MSRTNGIEPARRPSRSTDATIGALAIGAALRLVGMVVHFLTHVVAPWLFTHYDHFPALASAPRRAADADGRPGDPINLALVGTAEEIDAAFRLAGWTRASKIDRSDDMRLVKSILFRRPDPDAPVSPLYVFGREQDVAYEHEDGRTAGKRDHVRLWQSEVRYRDEDRPTWLAAATLDTRSGFIVRRLAPTHHIGPDIDEERDNLVRALLQTKLVAELFNVTGLGLRVASRNSSGDRFDTDGELAVIVLSRGEARVSAPLIRRDPTRVALKNRVWYAVHRDRAAPPRAGGSV